MQITLPDSLALSVERADAGRVVLVLMRAGVPIIGIHVADGTEVVHFVSGNAIDASLVRQAGRIFAVSREAGAIEHSGGVNPDPSKFTCEGLEVEVKRAGDVRRVIVSDAGHVLGMVSVGDDGSVLFNCSRDENTICGITATGGQMYAFDGGKQVYPAGSDAKPFTDPVR